MTSGLASWMSEDPMADRSGPNDAISVAIGPSTRYPPHAQSSPIRNKWSRPPCLTFRSIAKSLT